jgi:hypothetical protein
MSAERWLPVPEWPAYEVSDLGRVRRVLSRYTGELLAEPNVLKQTPSSDGYLRVHLGNVKCPGELGCKRARAGKRHRHQVERYVHALVMAAFVGPRPDDHDVHHVDHNRRHNTVANLEYAHISVNRPDQWHGPARTDWAAWEADSA